MENVHVAYIIFSYRNPEQIVQLACKLAANTSCKVFIHHDYSVTDLPEDAFKENANIEILPFSINVEWGDISMVHAMHDSMQYVFNNQQKFDWFILISEQDYPVRKVSEIEKHLAVSKYDGFLTYFSADMDKEVAAVINKRYFFWYFKLPKYWRLFRFYKWIAQKLEPCKNVQWFLGASNSGPRIGIKRRDVIFNKGFDCYKGQPWMTINRRCVKYVLETVKRNPKIIKYYSKTLIPEESIFNTILANNPMLKLKNDCRRYIQWKAGAAHPTVLTLHDYKNIVTSGKDFARKFDIDVDREIIQMLDIL
ncbi:beta-1,6-N-acetylglucosaminyltransferase [Desulfobacter postgatei]|jgi:hypothetical protein|uniref:beta-1,6-N-acetylglucosaminyltransferase n=1 Tax=Desulfobacter postgatei TaxID=2293 RepID=UPI002A369245|nr:beta-1,6-N-acetylglucosaminyltransferase [Desulfobacter postgatei]MDX9964223.1 beta-1,6-N-acetylglucosaminyltransferase [Desulfobacter postgatei]